MIPGKDKSEKLNIITGVDKFHLKSGCINSSLVNRVREPILYSSGLCSLTGHKVSTETKIKDFEKINKSVLSHITFYLEDDNRKPVDFNGKTISFTRQLIKKQKQNLDLVQPKNKTKDLLLSLTKNCETPIKQIQTKLKQTLKIKLTKPREIFHFNPAISIENFWMAQLISLEVYTSTFNIIHQNNKIELFTDTFDEFSFGEQEGELEELVDFSNISHGLYMMQ